MLNFNWSSRVSSQMRGHFLFSKQAKTSGKVTDFTLCSGWGFVSLSTHISSPWGLVQMFCWREQSVLSLDEGNRTTLTKDTVRKEAAVKNSFQNDSREDCYAPPLESFNLSLSICVINDILDVISLRTEGLGCWVKYAWNYAFTPHTYSWRGA